MLKNRKTYTGCAELPMYNFIQVVVHDKLDYLYAEPKRPWLKAVDVGELWDNIFSEYSSLSKDSSSLLILQLVKELQWLNNKIVIVESAIAALKVNYDRRLCDLLVRMGFRHRFTQTTYKDDLRRTTSELKGVLVKKMMAEKELKETTKDQRSASEKDYNNLIINLSKFMGFKIDVKSISVLDFVNIVESFKQHHKPTKNG